MEASKTMTDAERVAKATRPPFGRRWYGPVETQPCPTHTNNVESYLWTWRVGESIEDGHTELVAGCPECDRLRDEDGTP